MVTVDTVKKSWKNTVLGKYDANDWLTKDGSGKYAINLKCLLYLTPPSLPPTSSQTFYSPSNWKWLLLHFSHMAISIEHMFIFLKLL